MRTTSPRTGRRALARSLALLPLALALGCATARQPRPSEAPSFLLVDLILLAPADRLATTLLVVRVDNANAEPIRVETVRANVVLNGTLIGELVAAPDRVVPPRGQGRLDLRLDHQDEPGLANLRERPPPRGVAYRVTGEALVVGAGLDRVPIRLEGLWPAR